MSTGQHTITLVLITFFLATGCRKDSTEPSVPAPSYIAAQVDSAFIQAPNVMTPNADGINDLFSVSARNMVSLRTTIERMNGDTVFWSDSMYPVWAGPVPITLGRYHVHLSGMTVSGHHLSGRAYLDLLDYNGDTCLHFIGDPVTMDQFDPRTFGVSLPSSDLFCE